MKIDDEIHSLVDFTKERFGFKRPPTIFLNNDDENASKTLAKTGYYDPESMEIHIYTTGRHPKDILRSIAHELVHHNQNENGDFENAGYSGKGYAQKNPHLRKMELQANDPMLFRDWEDSLKEKYPTIYNEGRTNTMSLKDWKNNELSKNLTNKWGFNMDLTKLNENKQTLCERHCETKEEEEEKLEEELGGGRYVGPGFYILEYGKIYEGPYDSEEEAEKALENDPDLPDFVKADLNVEELKSDPAMMEEKELSDKQKKIAQLKEPKDKIDAKDLAALRNNE
jgi:hypothetical protein